MDIRRALLVLCAAALVTGCVGCSSENTGSKKKKNKAASSVSEQAVDESGTGDEGQEVQEDVPTARDGEYIMKLYDFMEQGRYYLKLRYTDYSGRETVITQTVRDGDCHIRQENELGVNGYISVDGTAYDYDLLCGMCRKNTKGAPDSLIKSVVEQDLPATDTHKDKRLSELYAAEEYTFVGDTYITVVDLYSDRDTAMPVMYTVTYIVEGRDEVVETREFLEIAPGEFFVEPGVDDESSADSAGADESSETPDSAEDTSGADESSETPDSAEEISESDESSETPDSAEDTSGADESSETPDSAEDTSGADESSGTEDETSESESEKEIPIPSEPVILPEIDESVFDTEFLSDLTDFESMIEERRLGYCEAILVTAGISQEQISYKGISEEKLRTISYDDFTALVYSLKEQ